MRNKLHCLRTLKTSRVLLLLTIILALIGLLYYSPTVPHPDSVQTLNMTLTDSSRYFNETTYAESMSAIAEPYLDQHVKSNYFTATDGSRIYYEQYLVPNATGTIVISHGFTESTEKYKELIYYFMQEGYSVNILEHRAHGRSERYVENLSKVHITDFNDFITDLHQFITEVVLPVNDEKPLFLYTHSMGGTIGAEYLSQYPDVFDAAILSSPMLEINLGSFPKPIATLVANVMHYTGFGETYVIGHDDFDPTPNIEESSASSQARYNYLFSKKLENELLQTNGATFSWLKTSLKATNSIVKKKNAQKVTTPTLLFQAEHDDMVVADGQNRFASYAPNTQMIFVPGAKHELFNTGNEIFVPYMNTVLDFFASHI